MYIKKRIGFLIFSTIFLITLIPYAFALLEGIYWATYNYSDIVSLYQQWSGIIDFAMIFVLVASTARISLAKVFKGEGNEEHPALKGIYLTLGGMAGIGLVAYSRYYGQWGQ